MVMNVPIFQNCAHNDPIANSRIIFTKIATYYSQNHAGTLGLSLTKLGREVDNHTINKSRYWAIRGSTHGEIPPLFIMHFYNLHSYQILKVIRYHKIFTKSRPKSIMLA